MSYFDTSPKHDPPVYSKATRGRLLDIGCGVGNFLVEARVEGWQCFGIEISPVAAAVARRRGFSVAVGDATVVQFPAGKFDHVRCAHTLEHVIDPIGLLRRLAAAVADGGEIAVIVPNRKSVTCAVFRRYWHALDVPRHLWHFRPVDIKSLASAVGLELKSVRYVTSPNGLLGSLECMMSGMTSGLWLPLRRRRRLRIAVLPLPWLFARVRLGDVIEYRLVRHHDTPHTASRNEAR